jgi:two-component system chemotaxis response regulator CheB
MAAPWGAVAIQSRKRTRQKKPECELIVIGASAGGLVALGQILSDLCPEFPPVIVVQHLDPRHKSQLAGLLSRKTRKMVKEAEDGELITRNTVYIGPPDEHVLVSRGKIQLAHSRLIRFSRPSIDVTLVAAAAAYGSKAIGVILSGSNRDGADGIAALKRAGGMTIAQNPATAEYRIMPQAAIDTGCIDRVVALNKLGKVISGLIRRGTAK